MERFTQTKEKRAWLTVTMVVRLQLPDHVEDPFYLVGGSRPEKHEKVSSSCCRSYQECKEQIYKVVLVKMTG